jgi:hypothetical protein
MSSATDDELVFGPVAEGLLREAWSPGIGLRLLGVGVSGFEERAQQLDLMATEQEPSRERGTGARRSREGLVRGIDAVRERFGDEAVKYGRELKTRRDTGTPRRDVPPTSLSLGRPSPRSPLPRRLQPLPSSPPLVLLPRKCRSHRATRYASPKPYRRASRGAHDVGPHVIGDDGQPALAVVLERAVDDVGTMLHDHITYAIEDVFEHDDIE